MICFLVMRCFRLCSWCLWKGLDDKGCMGFGSMTFGLGGAKALEYWMIFSLKIELNHSLKFRKKWNVPSVLLERSRWAGFNGIYLVRFGFRIWEIIISKWFLPLKIQINTKKTRFWKEKSVEDMVTLGPTAQATLVLTISNSSWVSPCLIISSFFKCY